MKNYNKGVVLGLVVGFMLGTFSLVGAEEAYKEIIAVINPNIKMTLNGVDFNPKDSDGNAIRPIIHNGNSYLPVRALCDAIKLPVDWNNNTQTIILGTNNFGDLEVKDYEVYNDGKISFNYPSNFDWQSNSAFGQVGQDDDCVITLGYRDNVGSNPISANPSLDKACEELLSNSDKKTKILNVVKNSNCVSYDVQTSIKNYKSIIAAPMEGKYPTIDIIAKTEKGKQKLNQISQQVISSLRILN